MNLGTATAARGGAEELEDAGDMNVAPHLRGLVQRARNHARQPGCSSQVRPGGGGVAISTGQTVSPEAEADGMGRTPISTPAPHARPKLAESRISALTRRSTAPKGSCETCADAEPMTDEQLKMYPGWTHICGVRGCGVTTQDGCAKHKAGMRPDVADVEGV